MVMPLIVRIVGRSIGMSIIDSIRSTIKKKAAAYKRKKTKELEEFKSTLKCEICGENRPWCLDFHHTNPEEKEGEIAKLIESPRRMQEEIKKCIAVCANCHRDIHYKDRNAGIV